MKNCFKILFIIIACSFLLIPAITTNFKENQVSEIDNTVLPEFPDKYDEFYTANIENYLSNRIGLRTEIISSYQNICYNMIGQMNHPLYVAGSNGQIYDDWDLNQYQHLSFRKEYIDKLSQLLKDARDLSHQNGAEFYFMYVPNKESIYPEDFPSGYTIFDNQSRSEYFVQKLSENNVNYYDVKEDFLLAKDTIRLFDDKYDPGHWNASGAFLANKTLVNNIISVDYPHMGTIDEDDYELTTIDREYLPSSFVKINESSKWYSLKNDNTLEDTEKFYSDKVVDKTNYYHHYVNLDGENLPKILIMSDSYFGSYDCQNYYKTHSSELILVHSYNQMNLPYYISFFKPDIVIFEAVERAVDDADNQFSFERIKNGYLVLDDTLEKELISGEEYGLPQNTSEIVDDSSDYHSVSFVIEREGTFVLEAIIGDDCYYAGHARGTNEYVFTFPLKQIKDNTDITYRFGCCENY